MTTEPSPEDRTPAARARDEIQGRIKSLRSKAKMHDDEADLLELRAGHERDRAARDRALAEGYQALVADVGPFSGSAIGYGPEEVVKAIEKRKLRSVNNI